MNNDSYRVWAEVALPSGLNWAPLYGVPEPLLSRAVPGQLVRVPLGEKQVLTGVIWSLTEKQPLFEVRPLEIPPQWVKLPDSWLHFLKWISDYYAASPNRAIDIALPKFAGAAPAEWLPKRTVQKKGESPKSTAENSEPLPPLTSEQQLALGQLLPPAKKYAPFLLHGVTGSGKTRLYAELIRQVVAEGKMALVLVPEIALTPQLRRHFEQLTQHTVQLYHSNIPLSERKRAWHSVVTGGCQLLLGTRSASLLPFQNLGCIIIDEEHDSSYKQEDPTPYYHARDALLWRARQLGIPILLGSATPSLETRALVDRQRIGFLKMEQRVHQRPLPKVHLIDMRALSQRYQKSLLSPQLREAIEAVLERGGQVILLHNRRGYAPSWRCKECGQSVSCPDCHIPITYHRARQQLHCHWCNRLLSPRTPCRNCGCPHYLPVGFGIEQVEQELIDWIPNLKITRLDRDTTARRGSLETLLEQFRSGETNLLLGTQMVAKGHDFPNVRLVGVVSADAGLAIPDFRAGERMFQLLTQVAGRAGRGDQPGEVYLQTYSPDEPLIRAALNHDYNAFRNLETEQRRAHGYPPYSRMVQLELSSSDEQKLQSVASKLQQLLKSELLPTDRLLGPAEAPLYTLRGRFRLQLLWMGPSNKRFREQLDRAISELALDKNRSIQLRINVDPQTML